MPNDAVVSDVLLMESFGIDLFTLKRYPSLVVKTMIAVLNARGTAQRIKDVTTGKGRH